MRKQIRKVMVVLVTLSMILSAPALGVFAESTAEQKVYDSGQRYEAIVPFVLVATLQQTTATQFPNGLGLTRIIPARTQFQIIGESATRVQGGCDSIIFHYWVLRSHVGFPQF